ncbi:MAG: BlaI/MecI/CopY family transcriptional regulator, partial [Bacteroidota bacterium]
KTEEKIMQILWKLKRGFVKDIIAEMEDDPKPPYNTISSVVRLLREKGYVDIKAYGKTHEYFPKVSKAAYARRSYRKILKNYFDNSVGDLLSFMAKDGGLSEADKKQIQEFLNQQKDAE